MAAVRAFLIKKTKPMAVTLSYRRFVSLHFFVVVVDEFDKPPG